MNSWVAIDFETASVRGTPCAVGLVEVEDMEIGARHGWLIRPPVFEFSPFNVALHGITPEMCRSASGWTESLERIVAVAAGRPLVAHNAAFDIGVIRDACDLGGLDWPRLEYACTLVVGRRLWPDLTNYSLPFVAAHLELICDDHHDPSADAFLAAQIGCRALGAAEVTTPAQLVAKCHAAMGQLDAGTWRGCHAHSKAPIPTESSPGAVPDEDHPLFGKRIAFTGALSIPRREAQQAVVNRGAIASRGVRRDTEFLVTGCQDLDKLARGESKSAKLRKAETMWEEGVEIEILGEGEFVQMLEGR